MILSGRFFPGPTSQSARTNTKIISRSQNFRSGSYSRVASKYFPWRLWYQKWLWVLIRLTKTSIIQIHHNQDVTRRNIIGGFIWRIFIEDYLNLFKFFRHVIYHLQIGGRPLMNPDYLYFHHKSTDSCSKIWLYSSAQYKLEQYMNKTFFLYKPALEINRKWRESWQNLFLISSNGQWLELEVVKVAKSVKHLLTICGQIS